MQNTMRNDNIFQIFIGVMSLPFVPNIVAFEPRYERKVGVGQVRKSGKCAAGTGSSVNRSCMAGGHVACAKAREPAV